MLTTEEKEGAIEAYKPLIVSRNAAIAEAKHKRDNGLVERLKQARADDWRAVGRLRNELKEQAREGVKK